MATLSPTSAKQTQLLIDALDLSGIDYTASDAGLHVDLCDDERAELVAQLSELNAEIDGLLDACCLLDDMDAEDYESNLILPVEEDDELIDKWDTLETTLATT